MHGQLIRPASRAEAPAVLDTLTLAFVADPVFRYWWPSAVSYLRTWPSFALAMGEQSFDHQTALIYGEGAAVSMWLPPGVEADPAQLASLDLSGTDEEERIGAEVRAEQQRFHPTKPHWYLWLIGVDPAFQRQGIGSALLRHTLKACDERQEIAFLESSDPLNVPFYEQHSFSALGEIRVQDVPVITPMIRHPR